MGQITQLQCEAYDIAAKRGFYVPGHELNHMEALAFLAMITSEVGEAIQCIQKNEWSGSENRIPTGFGIEMADIVIGVMSLSHALGQDLEAMILLKMKYNATRARMHERES